jgi:hypothetical protein
MHVPCVEHGDAAGEIDVAFALDVPDLGVRGTFGIDGERIRDTARNGGLTAGVKVCVLSQRTSPVKTDKLGAVACLLAARRLRASFGDGSPKEALNRRAAKSLRITNLCAPAPAAQPVL